MGQEVDLLWGVCPTRARIPAPHPEPAESASGSARRAVELIPASSECNCSCGACRERDKINRLYLLSFCFPSSSRPDPALTSQVLSMLTLQTRKPREGLTLTDRSCSTHMSLNGSSKSAEFLPCEQTNAKTNLRFSLRESVDGDTSTRQAFTGQISKEGCSHTALFHKHLLDMTAFFCQRVTNPFPELGLLFVWRDFFFLTHSSQALSQIPLPPTH